ncbi:hypothetical protein [Hymenobacter daeguensis]
MKSFTNFRTAQASATVSQRSFRLAALGLVVGLGLAASSSAQAQQAQAVQTKTDTESLLLTVNNPTLQRVQVKVVQLNGSTCLSNVVNHQASYGTKLCFAKLPAGQYDVMLRVGRERYHYAVQVKAQNSTISVRELNNQPADKAVATAAL